MSAAGRTTMTHMKIAVAVALLVGICALARGEEIAIKGEAIAMVKKAVAFVKRQGAEKAYAAFNAKGDFTDRDLYVVVYGLEGKVLAHGSSPKPIGKDMNDAQNVDGKYYIKGRLALAGSRDRA